MPHRGVSPLMTTTFSTVEMMAVVAAREIRDREVVFAGTGLPILAAALAQNPDLKVLAVSGYHDLATPFYLTELDLARLGSLPNVGVRNYAGGHMTYLDDISRPQERADLEVFYRSALAAQP